MRIEGVRLLRKAGGSRDWAAEAVPPARSDPLRGEPSSSAGIGVLLASGLLRPTGVLAADWNRPAFRHQPASRPAATFRPRSVIKLRENKKKPAKGGSLLHVVLNESGARDIRRLLALRALRHVEGNLLALFKGLESAHRDCGEVREEIFATIIGSNEAETFGVIEPLHCTSCHIATSLKKD
jgi:hypothetical protein